VVILEAIYTRDVVLVETSQSRDGLDVLTSCLGLVSVSEQCLGLGTVGLVSGFGPLHLVETLCAGAVHTVAAVTAIVA